MRQQQWKSNLNLTNILRAIIATTTQRIFSGIALQCVNAIEKVLFSGDRRVTYRTRGEGQLLYDELYLLAEFIACFSRSYPKQKQSKKYINLESEESMLELTYESVGI